MEKKFDPKRMANLVEGICEAFYQSLPGGRWAPIVSADRTYTFCNEAVNYVCKKMGYHTFDLSETPNPDDAKLANKMVSMFEESEDWLTVPLEEAQLLANYGYLVVAGWTNPNPSAPGHVAVVMPGNMEFSGSWASLSPKIMNVGKDCFISKKASYAFTKNSMPKYYWLKNE